MTPPYAPGSEKPGTIQQTASSCRTGLSPLLPHPSPRPSIISPFPLSPSLGRLLKTPASGQRPAAEACPASSASPVAARVAEAVAAAVTARLLSGSAARKSPGRPSWTWPSRSPGADGDEL